MDKFQGNFQKIYSLNNFKQNQARKSTAVASSSSTKPMGAAAVDAVVAVEAVPVRRALAPAAALARPAVRAAALHRHVLARAVPAREVRFYFNLKN